MRRGTLGTMAAAGLLAGTTLGAGFQLYTEGSAEALGQAAAISGRTNLVSLAWYNPAALAGAREASVQVGSTFVQICTDFNSAVGMDTSMADEWRIVPHYYFVMPVTERLTGMVSYNAPYGLITEWDPGWIGDGVATYTDLSAMYTTPSLAWQVSDRFAVAAGVNLVLAEAELRKEELIPMVSPRRTVEGSDLSFGYALSAHYVVAEDWSIGGRYQSEVDLTIEGNNSYTGSTEADLTLPPTLNLGVVNTTIDRVTLGLDFVWTGWSTYDELDVGDLTGASIKDWEDVWSVRLGAEYDLSTSWALRAGYVWDESPVPDATRAPELPGSDRQMLMAGLGWRGERATVDFAYSFLWAEEGAMGTDLTALSPAFDGEFETTTHLVALSVGYTF